MEEIAKAIEKFYTSQMKYCIKKFDGNKDSPKIVDSVVGEALTLIFATSFDFVPTRHNGNLEALSFVRQRYPRSIQYINAAGDTPLHGAASVGNVDVFKFFVKWHLDQNPFKRGALYENNNGFHTPLDLLIKSPENITPVLCWLLHNHRLLKGTDIEKKKLIHRAIRVSSTKRMEFLVSQCPSAVSSEDGHGNLPLNYSALVTGDGADELTDQDYENLRTLIQNGINHGGIYTIGGLMHRDQHDEGSCVLARICHAQDPERVWKIIEQCLDEADDYASASIVHAAISNKSVIPRVLFQDILYRFHEPTQRDEHGRLPLHHAVALGLEWEGGLSDLVHANRDALDEVDPETDLPILGLAALNYARDLGTLFELAMQSVEVMSALPRSA